MPLRWLLMLLLAACLLAPAVHARRLALVIGNDNYQFVDKLANARNDSDAMGRALQAAGFAVTRVQDQGREALFKAVDAFVLKVRKDDEVVVFYSGHGVQIDSAAYLLPVDIKADSSRQITRDALALDALVGDLSKARYVLVVVDACRNNPFAVKGQRAIGAERGLAPIEPPEGVAIILSAARGQTALDNLGPDDRVRNGVFTREFLKHMTTPGLQVRDLLLKVRDTVEQRAASINHKQRPALVDESRGQFYFYPPRAGAAASGGTDGDAAATERAYWRSVEASNDPQELRLYLQRYPRGRFVDLAQARLARLEAGGGAAPSAPPKTSVAALAPPARPATPVAPVPPAAPAAATPPAAPAVAGAGPGSATVAAGPAGNPAARKLYDAARSGNAAAMFSLGAAYFDGRMELAKDEVQAAYWYRQALEAGHARAMNHYGAMLLNGRGGLARNEAQALAWFRKSAEAGEGRAMNHIGNMYLAGQGGLPKDPAQARQWYERAVAAGSEAAQGNLAKLK